MFFSFLTDLSHDVIYAILIILLLRSEHRWKSNGNQNRADIAMLRRGGT